MFKKITVLVCAAAVFFLAGCNTMQGLGKDVSKLGGKIEQKAEEKKK